MKNKLIRVKISRYDPEIDEGPHFESYEIPFEKGMSAHSILLHIYNNIDNSIGFRNYYCCQGVCNTCLVRINGNNTRACTTPIKPGAEITIEPIKGFELIRDLAVDFFKRLK